MSPPEVNRRHHERVCQGVRLTLLFLSSLLLASACSDTPAPTAQPTPAPSESASPTSTPSPADTPTKARRPKIATVPLVVGKSIRDAKAALAAKGGRGLLHGRFPRTVTLTPDEGRSCVDYFAVELAIDVDGRLEAVNLVWSEP